MAALLLPEVWLTQVQQVKRKQQAQHEVKRKLKQNGGTVVELFVLAILIPS